MPVRLAPSSKSGSIFGGAQPPRLQFGAPSHRTRTRQASRNGGIVSLAPVNREGAIHCARGGRAPLVFLRLQDVVNVNDHGARQREW